MPPVVPPPKLTMAVLTWACLLPMVIALGYVFAPFRLPSIVEVALSTTIPVSMFTLVIMQRLTGVLCGRLYPT